MQIHDPVVCWLAALHFVLALAALAFATWVIGAGG